MWLNSELWLKKSMAFGVSGLGFGVWGLGFRAWAADCRVKGSRLRMHASCVSTRARVWPLRDRPLHACRLSFPERGAQGSSLGPV